MNELVIMNNKQAVTTSLKIAEVFGKEHKHVIESVENLTAENSAVKNLFKESTYVKRGKEYPCYYMNRDGFTLLAMGYTGKKALNFKLQYIDAFNKMEASIINQAPTNMIDALTLALDQAKTIEMQKQVIGELQPKVDYLDHILQSDSLFTTTQISKDYGMSALSMNKTLHELAIQYKQGKQWFLYAKYHDKGYTHSKTFVIEGDKTVMNTKWTQKGRVFLYETLKEHGIIPVIERN